MQSRIIKGSNIVSGKNPVKVEVTNPGSIASQPPILSGIRMASQKRIPSDDPKFPFGLEVVVQTDAEISPVKLAVICDGNVGKGSAGFDGAGVYTNFATGIAKGHPNVFLASWETPSWTPQKSIVVRLFSDTAIHATGLSRFN